MNTEHIRLTIPDVAGLTAVGSAFGTFFLKPLLEEGHSLIIASYGPSGSGKSTLSRAAVATLPALYAQNAAKVCKSNVVTFKVIEQKPEFRYRDFWEQKPFSAFGDNEILPRRALIANDDRYASGLDLFEHPPFTHLDGVDAIWLMRKTFYPEYAQRQPALYFGRMIDQLKETPHPLMPGVLQEMEHMGAFAPPSAKTSKESHVATLILMNDRPELKAAFLSFATQVPHP